VLQDDIPQRDAKLKKKLTAYAVKSIVFFATLVVLIVASVVGLVHCA
jgi:hypothetical protein